MCKTGFPLRWAPIISLHSHQAPRHRRRRSPGRSNQREKHTKAGRSAHPSARLANKKIWQLLGSGQPAGLQAVTAPAASTGQTSGSSIPSTTIRGFLRTLLQGAFAGMFSRETKTYRPIFWLHVTRLNPGGPPTESLGPVSRPALGVELCAAFCEMGRSFAEGAEPRV